MQDETQKAAATSRPGPQSLTGPEDRDIDVLQQPCSRSPLDNSGACEENLRGASQVLPVAVFQKTLTG